MTTTRKVTYRVGRGASRQGTVHLFSQAIFDGKPDAGRALCSYRVRIIRECADDQRLTCDKCAERVA